MKFTLFAISFFLASVAVAAPNKVNGFCVDAINKELTKLGMGTISAPAAGIKKEASGDHGITFSREGGEIDSSVNVLKMFNGSEQKLTVQVPSVLFGRYEEKSIQLNGQCQVKSMDMVADGQAVHMSADECRSISLKYISQVPLHKEDILEKSMQTVFPKHGWAQCDNPFAGAAYKLCRENYSMLETAREDRDVYEVKKESEKSAD